MPRLDTRTRLGYSTRILGLGYPDRSRQFDRFEMNSPKRLSYLSGGGGRTSGERPSGPHFTLFINNTVLLGLGGPGSQMHHRNTLVNLILYEIGPGRLPTGRMSLIEARQKKETHAFTKKYTEESWSNGCWSRNCLPKMKTMARFVFC